MTRVVRVHNWTHVPAIRKARFRCQHCSRLIEDGSDVVIEVRPGGSHGYHAEHFSGLNAAAALARAAQSMGDLRTCCCPSRDQRECLELRFGHTHFAEGECCTCICHDEAEEDRGH